MPSIHARGPGLWMPRLCRPASRHPFQCCRDRLRWSREGCPLRWSTTSGVSACLCVFVWWVPWFRAGLVGPQAPRGGLFGRPTHPAWRRACSGRSSAGVRASQHRLCLHAHGVGLRAEPAPVRAGARKHRKWPLPAPAYVGPARISPQSLLPQGPTTPCGLPIRTTTGTCDSVSLCKKTPPRDKDVQALPRNKIECICNAVRA